MKVLGIIPARYASTRFPGKPLVEIKGKPMIQRVYEQCLSVPTLNELIIATDDDRIMQVVKQFGGNVMMTGTHHKSGTDRCAEVMKALEKNNRDFDVIINIQGDEPYIEPKQIDQVSRTFDNHTVMIATLAKKIDNNDDVNNPNVVKVVIGTNGQALYFSRYPIPFLRTSNDNNQLTDSPRYKHIGLYAYRPETLKAITKLAPSPLEQAESLEQLRWLENGFPIFVEITEFDSMAVDRPEDLSKFSNNH